MSVLSDEVEHGVLSRVLDDEPLFVLRAKDVLAIPIIELWIELAERAGVHCSVDWLDAGLRGAFRGLD